MAGVLFQSGDITVTRFVAKFGNATYPIVTIRSVIIERENTLLFVLSVVAIIAGLIVGANIHEMIGLIAFVAFLFLANNVPEKRRLILKTTSGDVTALGSHDAMLVESVRQAIEDAVTR
ncbi:hypothetical protein M2281_005762 [Mesorhizobium soli]|uniref:DUF6232 family protein n=1 Tax=Pseudaminobacter soli (ex Li et al. 2025) TaxID=1295366 RepID=UPI0024756633|nr:DUF6232 family protein [Mesorhizobium soli]MDH6235140.1 hypothetical protein [Mesorhizobium soli]